MTAREQLLRHTDKHNQLKLVEAQAVTLMMPTTAADAVLVDVLGTWHRRVTYKSTIAYWRLMKNRVIKQKVQCENNSVIINKGSKHENHNIRAPK